MEGEIRKQRPAVIVSNDASNQHLSRVQIVSCTSSTERIFPCEASVILYGQVRKAMADQIITVSKLRLSSQVGSLSLSNMERVKQVIKVQLNL